MERDSLEESAARSLRQGQWRFGPSGTLETQQSNVAFDCQHDLLCANRSVGPQYSIIKTNGIEDISNQIFYIYVWVLCYNLRTTVFNTHNIAPVYDALDLKSKSLQWVGQV